MKNICLFTSLLFLQFSIAASAQNQLVGISSSYGNAVIKITEPFQVVGKFYQSGLSYSYELPSSIYALNTGVFFSERSVYKNNVNMKYLRVPVSISLIMNKSIYVALGGGFYNSILIGEKGAITSSAPEKKNIYQLGYHFNLTIGRNIKSYRISLGTEYTGDLIPCYRINYYSGVSFNKTNAFVYGSDFYLTLNLAYIIRR